METIKAINPKNQSKVNKAISWLTKYNLANDQRDIADGNGDEKAFNKLDTKCQNAFDKYLCACDDLPKNQIKAIENSIYY